MSDDKQPVFFIQCGRCTRQTAIHTVAEYLVLAASLLSTIYCVLHW